MTESPAAALQPTIARLSITPSVLAVLLHLGGVIRTVKDIVIGVEDLIQGHGSKDDAKRVLSDIGELLSEGVIQIPGLTSDQVAQMVADLENIA